MELNTWYEQLLGVLAAAGGVLLALRILLKAFTPLAKATKTKVDDELLADADAAIEEADRLLRNAPKRPVKR